MRENKTCLDQGWNQMPTEELDQLLQEELEKEHPNEEVVLPILHELEEREKDYPVVKTPEVLAVLNKLSKHETTSKQSKINRGWIAGIAALAAVVCIVVMAMPRTVGAESFLDVLFRWTGSVFEFFTPEQDVTNPPVEHLFVTDNPGLQQLYDEVTALGVTESVVPTWLPEGFVVTEIKNISIPSGNKVYGRFENGNMQITITFLVTTYTSSVVEKEEAGVEVFESSGISHFIMENVDNVSATWSLDGVECLLNGNIAKEDIYLIIKSIYRSGLSR